MNSQSTSISNDEPVEHTGKIYIGSMGTTGSTHIPKEVREFLRLKPHNPIIYRIRDNKVELTSSPMTLEDACGSVTPLQPNQDLEEVIREAKAEHYQQRVIKKMGA